MAHTKHSVDYICSKGGSLLMDSSKPQTKHAIRQTRFAFAGEIMQMFKMEAFSLLLDYTAGDILL